jgi:hypothetical protein
MKILALSSVVLAVMVLIGPYHAFAQPRDEEAGTKFCSVVVGDNWRDSINVPQAWTAEDCEEFRVAMGASEMQIGCIFDRGRTAFSVAEAGYVPRPNCGWEEPRRRTRTETRGPRDRVSDWEIIIDRSRRR